jgi:hypothetical protein
MSRLVVALVAISNLLVGSLSRITRADEGYAPPCSARGGYSAKPIGGSRDYGVAATADAL